MFVSAAGSGNGTGEYGAQYLLCCLLVVVPSYQRRSSHGHGGFWQTTGLFCLYCFFSSKVENGIRCDKKVKTKILKSKNGCLETPILVIVANTGSWCLWCVWCMVCVWWHSSPSVSPYTGGGGDKMAGDSSTIN